MPLARSQSEPRKAMKQQPNPKTTTLAIREAASRIGWPRAGMEPDRSAWSNVPWYWMPPGGGPGGTRRSHGPWHRPA